VAPNLRTFLPPPPTAPAPLPALGDAAPEVPGIDLGDGRPRVVAFLRHPGCPFAEATMRAAREVAAQPAGGLEVVAVVHAGGPATEAWCRTVGGAGSVRVVRDEARLVYAGWGLGRSSLRHFAGARSLRAAVALLRSGIRNTRAHGTRWQTAGTFAVDAEGRIAWRHLPAHAGDLPDLDAAAAAATGAAGTSS
jgi:hypothetical protein